MIVLSLVSLLRVDFCNLLNSLNFTDFTHSFKFSNQNSSEQMIIDNQCNNNDVINNRDPMKLDSKTEPMDSFAMISNTLNFHNPLNSFPGFDTSVNFMQSSFSSENQSSPSTPLGLNTMLNTQHTNSPNSPNLNSLNTQSSSGSNSCRDNSNNDNNGFMPMSRNQFNQIQQNNKHLIHNSTSKVPNPMLNSRYNNESDEEDFINWENLL